MAQSRVPVETRARSYSQSAGEFGLKSGEQSQKMATAGSEIVREATVCPQCIGLGHDRLVAEFWVRERADLKRRAAILESAQQVIIDAQGRRIEPIAPGV